ncbi:MAG TPA: helix-turn-helix transcriptional regulator [Gaiellaceae bacterium]|nr:helix-turn-helix transcriptional regulator [Gaiellaceae bacterium]
MQALRDPAGITDRQREVVELIAQGLSNEEVGVVLGISPRTAKAHSDILRQKLGVQRRRQIPVAFRLLTGEDPLARRLASARADNGG